MRRRSVLLGAMILALAGTGLGLGRSAARELAEPAATHMCSGHGLLDAGIQTIGFKVRATDEFVSSPAYEACLARIDAADIRTTVSLGVEGRSIAPPPHGISLIAESGARGFESTFQRGIGSISSFGGSGGSSGKPIPGSSTPIPGSTTPTPGSVTPAPKPKPGGVFPGWRSLFLVVTCFSKTCSLTPTCSGPTCSTTNTCYARTCEQHFTCSSVLSPHGCQQQTPATGIGSLSRVPLLR